MSVTALLESKPPNREIDPEGVVVIRFVGTDADVNGVARGAAAQFAVE